MYFALVQLAGVLGGNNAIQREDQQRNTRLGIILEVFKGGRQMNSNESLGSPLSE